MHNQPSSLIQNILTSTQPGMISFRRVFISIGLAGGLVLLAKFFYYTALLVSGNLNTWMRDIYQYYLIGRAVLEGLSPYTSLDILATRFLGGSYVYHPAPYPPPFVAVVTPLGLFRLSQMVLIWGLIQMICLVWIAVTLQRWLKWKVSLAVTGLICLLVICWYPILDDLMFGNVMIILLAFLAAAWLALREGKQIQGGLLLGFVISIKLIGWLLIPYLFFKRQWRVLFSLISAVLIANLLAGFILGFDQVMFYYKGIGAQTLAVYQAAAWNNSIWSLGWRIFSGTYPASVGHIEAPPLLANPLLARVVSWVLMFIVTWFGLKWAIEARDFDLAFSIILCASILINPVAWSYYFCLLLIPFCVLVRKQQEKSFPNRESLGLLFLSLAFLVPPKVYSNLASLSFGTYHPQPIEGGFRVSFLASLFTLFPMMWLFGLIWLLRQQVRLNELE